MDHLLHCLETHWVDVNKFMLQKKGVLFAKGDLIENLWYMLVLGKDSWELFNSNIYI